MKRNLSDLTARSFDLAIIGGGIVGAAIARDAARRGLTVALVEQNDFACAASEAMSRMIHGGIRYLAQGRISLVREALAERTIWQITAPDFVKDQPFIAPLARGVAAWQVRAGVALYQRLGGRRSSVLSASEAVALEPCLAGPELAGAVTYDDARVDEPDRLILAMLQDAAAHDAGIANHVKCLGLVSTGGKVCGIEVVDELTGAPFPIRAGLVVNATGPWAQNVADLLLPGQTQARLTASKGIHILTESMTLSHALALSGKGEHGFILPWKGMSLVGTTDDEYRGDAKGVDVTLQDIERLTAKIVRLLPAAEPFLESPLGAYAGVRAIPGSMKNTYRAAREVAYCDHTSDGMQGLHSVFGCKWTNARLTAERFLDGLAAGFAKKLNPCKTRTAAITGKTPAIELHTRLQHAADEEMALTRTDFLRRLGRRRSHGQEEDLRAINRWLASRDRGSDSAVADGAAGGPK